jgi:hypothetical protein
MVGNLKVNECVGEWSQAPGNQKAQEGPLVGSHMLTLSVKPQWDALKWFPIAQPGTIEISCSDFLAHTLKVCNDTPSYQLVSDYKGWSRLLGNVYTLYIVKTILTVMLTVMSAMDPHMISWDTGWDQIGWDLLGFVWLVGQSETLWCDWGSVKEVEIHLVIRLIKAHILTTIFCKSNQV